MTLIWRRSGRCDAGACVEVALDDQQVVIREFDVERLTEVSGAA